MSLDTESSVGEECAEQGQRLHGGHTAKGAGYRLHFLSYFGTKALSFLDCYIKPLSVLNTSAGFSTNNFCLFLFF